MKKRYALIMIVLLGLCSPVWADEKVTVPNMGLSMVLPQDWFLVPEEQAAQITSNGAAVIATDGEDDQFILVISKEPASDRSMGYAISSTVHYVYNTMRGFVDEEEDMTIGGEKAFRLRYESSFAKDGSLPNRYLRVLALKDGFLYTFQGSTRRDYFKKHEGTLLNILKTVSWTKIDPEGIKEEDYE